jgi:hypothetical protein
MKTFIVVAALAVASIATAQTPSVKWTVSSDTVQGFIQLSGKYYPFDFPDTSRFVLFNQASTTPKYTVSFPSGFTPDTRGVESIPDISGDGKDDIEIDGGQYDDAHLFIDGNTGVILYQLSSSNGRIDFIGDVVGDGKNEIVWVANAYQGTPTYVIYATNGTATAVASPLQSSPTSFRLMQNYPNPFNPSTVISYSIPMSTLVTLKVYDVLGRQVATLVNEQQAPGLHSITLNAGELASGVYFYQLQAGNTVQAKKLMVIK